MNETFQMGLELMGYGLIGVFSTLGVFMLMIKLLTTLFAPHEEEK